MSSSTSITTNAAELWHVGDRILVNGRPAIISAVHRGTLTVRWRSAWYWRAAWWLLDRWRQLRRAVRP